MQLDLNRLYDVIKQVSLDGYIDVVKLTPDEKTVNVDLMDKGRMVGIHSKYSREYLPLNKKVVISADSTMKVIRNLFKYNPIAEFTATDTDIIISNSDTSYVVKMREDAVFDNVMKPKSFEFGQLPLFERTIIASYTVDADALGSIKTDENTMELVSNEKGLMIKFKYLEGESSRIFYGEKATEDFDVYFDANLINKITSVLSGKISLVLMKGKAYQLMIGKPDKYSVIAYLLNQRVK